MEESKQAIARLQEEQQKLSEQLQADIAAITERWNQVAAALTTEQLKPRRTDVDVRATALAGLEEGYGVFVASDASGSRRRGDYEAALARMRRNGVEIVTAEMAIFELLGRAGTPEFKRVLPWLK